ncbi:ABC transporter substrate-binding protein [Dactylosporangium sp. NPDC049140]|uniref:ABC transporter substrate-binding protein n=1 Tax=Dactylosporangium sp. NPDC049140 TaxID=3155647 RepID=UPI003404700B
MTTLTKLAAIVAATTLTAACSGGSATGPASGGSGSVDDFATTHKKGGSVTIANESGQTWTCQFNPFNPAVNGLANGIVYEPLVYVNAIKNAAETPMLAQSYKWSGDKKSITFTVRDGVKWSDGQPFSAADVAFTFNLMKKAPATDLYSLWTGAGLLSATSDGNQATLTFNAPAEPYFYSFAGRVTVVPQHIWSTGAAAADPATWDDTAPVGTGPFAVNPCSPNEITYTANPTYWQPGKPYIQTVHYPAYLDNNPANLDLASGKAQWGGQYIPDIDNFYTRRSPNNHYWFAPITNVALYPNLAPSHTATSNPTVRRAIALALDRNQVSQIGESGYQPAANQTGIVLPTFQSYYDDAAATASGYTKPDVAKATSLMASAGYSPAHPLNLAVITVTGYTDWDASLAVIKQQLKPIGINLTVSDLAGQTYNDRLYKGDFDLAYSGQNGGPTPYTELREMLHSKNSAPLGSDAASNFERYDNPSVDALLDQYPAADETQRVAIIKKIEAAMLADVPVIPTTESVNWYEYNTQDLGGWPTADNPYAQAAPFNVPDIEQVLLHLYSKSAQH